jgi:hypothetical protein
MAFEMYCQDERAFIDHHEEALFELVRGSDRYPRLDWIWSQFYADPKIHPEMANELVHELIQLRTTAQGDNCRRLLHVIDRLLPFFSRAYTANAGINCASD